MTVPSDSQFRNIRLSFLDFIVKEMAKTDYAKNNISFRGESNTKLKTDDVRCRLDLGSSCSLSRPEYKSITSPNSNKCNAYTCPYWLPTFINMDEIDFQANDRRIVRVDFMNRELVNSRYDIIQVGVWSNKGDDKYKHKLYLLRDTIIKILSSDITTNKGKTFKILNWDSPESPPPALEGRPQTELGVVIHIKEAVKRPVATNGEFGEVFTVWLVSHATQRLVDAAIGEE